MRVGLFVPCYIDALHPQAAISTLGLLKRFSGLDVEFLEQASCCGLPLTDMGYKRKARGLETSLADIFAPYDAIVMPSGVCSEQVRDHLDSIEPTPTVARLRRSTYDVVDFLTDVLDVKSLPWGPRFEARVALHNGCHSLRYLHQARPSELMIPDFSKPERLLRMVEGCDVGYATRRDECCGFGGMYTVWDSPCSGQQGLDKVSDYWQAGFRHVVSQDYSCLMHQQGVARKNGLDLKFYYIAELLNGDAQP